MPKEYIPFCLFFNTTTGVILNRLLHCFLCLQTFSMLLQEAVVPQFSLTCIMSCCL